MKRQAPSPALSGWTPIIGPLCIWFAHFLVIYAAALIWPHQPLAARIGIVATVPAIIALGVLFWRLRTAEPTSGQTRFARRFGFGSIFIATAGVLFDAMPALFA